MKAEKNEKQYLIELAEELKRFLGLELEEKEKVAFDLNDNWQCKCRGCPEVSKKTEDIVSTLLVMHHYPEDPEEHDQMIKQILRDIRERLETLEKEEKAQQDEKDQFNKDSKDGEKEQEILVDDNEDDD